MIPELKFSQMLKELMAEQGIKSDKLGKAIGVSGQTVRAWCDGTQQISLSNLVKTADFFHCTTDYLVGHAVYDADFSPKPCPPFYESLRKVMAEQNVTRYRLTTESEIKDAYLTNWKRGADPYLTSLIYLADYLGVSIEHLIGRD